MEARSRIESCKGGAAGRATPTKKNTETHLECRRKSIFLLDYLRSVIPRRSALHAFLMVFSACIFRKPAEAFWTLQLISTSCVSRERDQCGDWLVSAERRRESGRGVRAFGIL